MSEENKSEDPITEAVQKFNAENPDRMALAFNTKDEKTGKQLDEFLRRMSTHPNQIVAYETEMSQPYTREQWPTQRAFLERTYRMGMFNGICCLENPSGGGILNYVVRGIDDLYRLFEEIEDGFRRVPNGTTRYMLGMQLKIKEYKPDEGLVVTNDWKEI